MPISRENISEKAIILKAVKYSESDLVVHCLNEDGVLVKLMAKGALRSRKRFAGGVLEPTHYVQLNYKSKEGQGEDRLNWLNEATLLNDFAGLRVNYDRLELALYFLKLIGNVSQAGDVHSRELFDLLGNALKALLTTEDPQRLKTHLEIKLLRQQGVLPEEMAANLWLKVPVVQHEAIDVSPGELKKVRNQVHWALKNYLGR